MEDIAKFIREVPKTELHLHIEGTLEPELMFDLAKRNDIKIPYSNVDEVKSAYNFSNLETFLNIYYFNKFRKVCLIGLIVLTSLNMNCLVNFAGNIFDVYKLTIPLVVR